MSFSVRLVPRSTEDRIFSLGEGTGDFTSPNYDLNNDRGVRYVSAATFYRFTFAWRNELFARSSMFLLLMFSLFVTLSTAQDLDLSTSLTASGKGFRILGSATNDNSGFCVSAAGDVNDDGVDDIIVGAYGADQPGKSNVGVSYVIFGRVGSASTFADFQLPNGITAIGPGLGFRILGAAVDDYCGFSVSAAGDVNHDGVADVIVGAYGANPGSGSQAGISYVIFGRSASVQATNPFGDIQLPTTTMTASVGFRILGSAAADKSGWSVGAAGDVNNDGVDDVIVGAPFVDLPSGRGDAGVSYVIFGRDIPGNASPFGDIQLTIGTALLSSIGFRILGAAATDCSGIPVGAAGDVNNDGISDVLVGAHGADAPNGVNAGITYVIFGRHVGGVVPVFGDIQLTTGSTPLATDIGFRILGAAAGDISGRASAAGDVNGDGIGDIIIGASEADPSTGTDAGVSYIIFGSNVPFGDIQLTNSGAAMPANVGFRILGAAAGDVSGYCVSAAGDVNNDGISDVIVGAYGADPPVGVNAGITYVIYGRDIDQGAASFGDIQLMTGATALSPSIGFRVLGAASGDNSGYSVSAAGDVNGDGIGDVIIGARQATSAAGISYVIFGVDLRPTSQPSRQPSQQPSRQPSRQPTCQPSRQPSGQPTRQPTTQPSFQPNAFPTSLPSRQPSAQPSAQPVLLPTAQPSGSPSSQPSSQPIASPTSQPSRQPSRQPSAQPTAQPFHRPSAQPSSGPSVQPSGQPSNKPSGQPSAQPSQRPSTQPSSQPSIRPSAQPSSQPSAQPSTQPSNRPSGQPSNRPSTQPSTQPSSRPSGQPSSHPSVRPSTQPSRQPSSRPSPQPSSEPSVQPSVLPSNQPSAQPSSQPSQQPSVQPSSVPSAQPSTQPFGQPSTQPTSQPFGGPSAQPSSQPSDNPSFQPSSQPSMQPSDKPSAQPSSGPSTQPSSQPSSKPSAQFSELPSTQPTIRPSAQPFGRPTGQPSCTPSSQPTRRPSDQPSALPSFQPFGQPTSTPSSQPTSSPTNKALTGEWISVLVNTAELTRVIAFVNNSIWACSMQDRAIEGSTCTILNALEGTQLIRHALPWTDIASVIQGREASSVAISRISARQDPINAELATCSIGATQLTCSAMSLENTIIVVGSYAPAVDKLVYIGTYHAHALVMIVDYTAANIPTHSFLYSSAIMKTVTFSHIQSPPNYIGVFVAGTCANGAHLNYICAGTMRTDSGTMTTMYVAPATGYIVNSAELVNAMALEYANPDSFIAGGLQLTGDRDMHAYLLCVNSIHRKVMYGMRYVRKDAKSGGRRRAQLNQNSGNRASVVKGMVLVDSFLYLIVAYRELQSLESMAVLKTDMATGNILQQVQIYSTYADIECTDIVSSGLSLVLACTVRYIANNSTQSLVLSVNRDLTFSQLPAGFARYRNVTFTQEPVAFKRTFLSLTATSVQRSPVEYTFHTTDVTPLSSGTPTQQPSAQPSSSAPSDQPSSSPTAAPSVSPQPSSQPSSSGPTNTCKPTAKPTQRPSRVPSMAPTVSPTVRPTATPTARPSAVRSVTPSAQPSVTPTVRPTRSPTSCPTRFPSVRPSIKPTLAPTEAPTLPEALKVARSSVDPAYAIVGYVVAGLLGLWLLYCLRRWCSYRLTGVQSDANRALYAASMGAKPKPRFPIFSFLVSLFLTVKAEEIDFVVVNNDETAIVPKRVKASPTTESVSNTFAGIGAFVEGPAAFRDLEANQPGRVDAKDQISPRIKEAQCTEVQDNRPNESVPLTQEGAREEIVSSLCSSLSSEVDVTLSAESLQENSISDADWDYSDEGADEEAVFSSHYASSAELSEGAYSLPDDNSFNANSEHSYIDNRQEKSPVHSA